jgi:DGQHR domain-containing protein
MASFRETPKQLPLCALLVKQPVGTFYIASIKATDLFEIAKFDVRRITQQEGIDEFLGIQRKVSKRRLVELKQYIRSVEATFPTAVIIAVDERCVSFSVSKTHSCFGILTLSNYIDSESEDNDILYRDIAKIIDGQHRVKAFEEGIDRDFEINLAIFVGADVATQAEIFSTVNLAQTKVNRSLVYDLFSLAHTRSPEKTAHEITVLLDRRSESPFHKRIKRLGIATEGRFGETPSQATVVRGILAHITKSAFIDRDIGKRQSTWTFHTGDERRFVFRYHFVKGEDQIIFLNIFNYFLSVRERWPEAWNNTGVGSVLPRTNGYLALMRFIRPVILAYSTEPVLVPKKHYDSVLTKIRDKLPDRRLTTENYKPGTSGETQLYRDLMAFSDLDELMGAYS